MYLFDLINYISSFVSKDSSSKVHSMIENAGEIITGLDKEHKVLSTGESIHLTLLHLEYVQ